MKSLERMMLAAAKETHCSRPRRVTRGNGEHTFIRCESASPKVCPSCARLRALDLKRLIGSGCNVSERDGITAAMLGAFRFYFVTFTAPSFGAIHRVPKSAKSPVTRCACGETHKHGDELQGTPMNLRKYRFKEQIAWNAACKDLFSATTKQLNEELPDVEWCFVREWQKRGALHFHGIVRVPSGYDDAKVWAVLASLRAVKANGVAWGKEADVKSIDADSAGNSVRYMAKVIAYTAKQQGEDFGVLPLPRRKFYDRLDWHAKRVRCHKSGCDDRACESRLHRSFGYAGHMMTHSKGWSLVRLTRTKLVEERRAYAQEHAGEGDRAKELAAIASLNTSSFIEELNRERPFTVDVEKRERMRARLRRAETVN